MLLIEQCEREVCHQGSFVKCPICKKYTYNIHNKLKPMKIKYLKMTEQKTEIQLIKIRFLSPLSLAFSQADTITLAVFSTAI